MGQFKTHKDVEFHVNRNLGAYDTIIFKSYAEACAFAVTQSMTQGRDVHVDVVVWTRAGAKWLEGDSGVEQYDEDPEVSVFKRLVIKAHDEGQVA